MRPARTMDKVGGALVASTAVLEGEFTLADGVSVWWNSVLRGDDAPLFVGEQTNIQDLCMVHPDPGVPLRIGRDVTIGHKATIHCVRIGDRCLIGINSTLLTGVEIGEDSIVAAGAVVPEGMVVPPRVMVAGVPARIKRDVRQDEIDFAVTRAEKYWREARRRAGIL
ncbi:MAG: gamma carbonic anhydrase family protein [Planctomycetes bacterium]|nr:gamma carbonic anhydrase family protein [Planctomycetota bacterium]